MRSVTAWAVRCWLSPVSYTHLDVYKRQALIGAFCQANPLHFHAADGEGYTFFADQVLALNVLNPQIAARLMTALSRWRRFDTVRQDKMRGQLERILASPQLSPDVYEIAFKTLEKA